MTRTTAMTIATLLWISSADSLSLEGYPITISLNKPGSGTLYTLTVNGNAIRYMSLENAKSDGERYAKELDQFKAKLPQ